jgi:nucleoid-associated protein YgaU
MWIATEIADDFDKLRKEDDRILDDVFQGWVDYAVKHEDDPVWYSALRNAAIYTGAGILYGSWKLSSTVASGFLDTLRLGDGVKEGGWGYAQDALRLLVVAGPVLRIGRFGLSKLASVDMFPQVGNCAWVAAAKALRMTGVRHFATLDDLAKAAGAEVESLGGVYGFSGIAETLKSLGAATKPLVPQVQEVTAALKAAVKANPNSSIIFRVFWNMNGQTVGHAMVAARNPVTGAMQILDRSGAVVSKLSELEKFYPNIGSALLETIEPMLAVKNATIATAMELLSKAALVSQTGLQLIEPKSSDEEEALKKRGLDAIIDPGPLINTLGLEVRSVPFRTEQKRRVEVPVRPITLPSDLNLYSSTVCTDQYQMVMNDGMGTVVTSKKCVTESYEYKTYKVRAGDCLTKISKAFYGTPNLWKMIYQANRQLLGPDPHDPKALRVGMVLHIVMSAKREETIE